MSQLYERALLYTDAGWGARACLLHGLLREVIRVCGDSTLAF